MTKEERELTITYLEGMKEEYIEGEGYERHPFPEWFALDYAIKALDQEPFINKPCISAGVCEHDKQKVLDKIREEIRHFMMEVNPSSSESDYACNYILGILDKYKSESEEK